MLITDPIVLDPRLSSYIAIERKLFTLPKQLHLATLNNFQFKFGTFFFLRSPEFGI
jgi:hypothetical protein